MSGLIVVSGPIKSGKGVISKVISTYLQCRTIAFGDYLQQEARNRGLAIGREQLQALGQELVTRDVRAFCDAVLQFAGFVPTESLVVDGVRHTEVLRTLAALTGEQPLIVYLVCPIDVRAQRAAVPIQVMEQWESHAVERETRAIRSLAHLVLDTSRPLVSSQADVVEWLGKRFL